MFGCIAYAHHHLKRCILIIENQSRDGKEDEVGDEKDEGIKNKESSRYIRLLLTKIGRKASR